MCVARYQVINPVHVNHTDRGRSLHSWPGMSRLDSVMPAHVPVSRTGIGATRACQ